MRSGRYHLPRTHVPGGHDAGLLLAARVAMSSQRALVGVVVPIYLAQLGFSALKLAMLFALVAATSTAMSAGIGFFADRVGRKPFLVALPIITAGCAVVFAVTRSDVAVFAAAALGSFGRGSGAGGGQIGPYTPAEQALLAGMVRDRDRPRLFGWVASASALGGLCGSALAALPTGHAAPGPFGPGTYRVAFVAAAVLATVAGACAVPVADATVRFRSPAGRRPHRPLSAYSWSLVYKLWMTNASNGIAVGLFGPFVTYWFFRRFGAGTTEIGALYVVINVVTFGTNLLAAPIARRFGVVRTVVVARTLQALLLIPLAVAPSFVAAGAIYLVRMMVQRSGMAMRQSFIMTAAPAADRGRVGAYSALPTQVLSAAAPTLTGYLFDEVSLSLPFELAGLLQLVNAALFHHFFAHFDIRGGAEGGGREDGHPAADGAAEVGAGEAARGGRVGGVRSDPERAGPGRSANGAGEAPPHPDSRAATPEAPDVARPPGPAGRR